MTISNDTSAQLPSKTNIVKRSKNGCLSCKKLKIKCDESKPKCEYCQHTDRECCYPDPNQPIRRRKRRRIEKDSEIDTPQTTSEESALSLSDNSMSLTRIRSAEFDEMFDIQQCRSFDQFVYNKALSAPNIQLSMSKFEFRLLDFFHTYCVRKFSEGTTAEVKFIWKNHVPTLFLESRLVRCSVFSFAALNMIPKCDLNQLVKQDFDSIKEYSNECTTFDHNLTVEKNLSHLHERTVSYFSEAARITRALIGDTLESSNPNIMKHANELSLSSMLIFAFILSEPNYFIPVVSFDRSEADFISMTKGITLTIQQCAPVLLQSEFAALFVGKKTLDEPPANCTFPLLKKLEDDFLVEYPLVDEFSADYLLERESLLGCIHQLQMLFRKILGFYVPNMGFRWGVFISDELQELVYSKNFFALHVVFVYAAIVFLRKNEQAYGDNMWLSYMRWFKSHNFELFGRWKYASDEKLFYFTHERKMRFKSTTMIGIFDPEAPGCEGQLTVYKPGNGRFDHYDFNSSEESVHTTFAKMLNFRCPV